MADSLVEQLHLVTELTGNEDVVIGINNKLVRVKSQLLQTAGVTITTDTLGLGNVDDTPDLDKPLSTAAIEALSKKADADDLAGLVTTEAFTLAIDTKADKEALASLVTKSIFDEALLLKADKTDLNGLATTLAVSQALADKLDADVFNLYTAQVAPELDKIAGKAESSHQHVYNDISDLVELIDHIKTALRPIPSTTGTTVTDTNAQIGVDITNVNGYNLSTVEIKLEYKAQTDTDWTTAPSIIGVNGIIHYTANLTGLVASTQYSVKLALIDSNSPESLTQSTVFDFTTLATQPV